MIKTVCLGEEIIITTKNKVGLLSDIARLLSEHGINIEAVSGYEVGITATLMLVTNANLAIVNELKRKRYRLIREVEVIIVDLENKPGSLQAVTDTLRAKKIDIKHLYVSSSSSGESSRMVLLTSDNEAAIAALSRNAGLS